MTAIRFRRGDKIAPPLSPELAVLVGNVQRNSDGTDSLYQLVAPDGSSQLRSTATVDGGYMRAAAIYNRLEQAQELAQHRRENPPDPDYDDVDGLPTYRSDQTA